MQEPLKIGDLVHYVGTRHGHANMLGVVVKHFPVIESYDVYLFDHDYVYRMTFYSLTAVSQRSTK